MREAVWLKVLLVTGVLAEDSVKGYAKESHVETKILVLKVPVAAFLSPDSIAKALENVALNSVRRAAPFPAPAWSVRRGDGSVNFLETFLFRDDGRFQIRSLVAAR